MSVTRNDPGTIFLGGDRTQIGEFAASEAITPGHLIERFNNGGVQLIFITHGSCTSFQITHI